jgi:hypothetical protein
MKDLEKHVLEFIGESTDSPDVYTDDFVGMAQIRDSLNDAIEEISMVTGATQRTYTLPLKDGVIFYRLIFTRDQIGWITDAWLRPINRRLEQKDVFALNEYTPNWMQNSRNPMCYFPIGANALGIWPKPADSTLILELSCVVIPSRYAYETDRIKLKESFQSATVHFAVGEYYATRGDAKQAIYHHGIYAEKMGLQDVYEKQGDRRWKIKTQKEQTS